MTEEAEPSRSRRRSVPGARSFESLGERESGRRRWMSFDRQELNQILAIYSLRVARGEWRDYAIDQKQDLALFSIFRSSFEQPLFTIAKRRSRKGAPIEYLVYSGREMLERSPNLKTALASLGPSLTLVS